MALTLISLGGCGLGDKPVDICKEIVRSGSVDPGAVRWNSVEKTKGALSAEDLERAWSKKFDGKLPPSTRELLNLYRNSPSELSRTFVEIDYTAQGTIGLKRDKALCMYYSHGDRTELISVTLNNKDYSPSELFAIFGNHRLPRHLSSAYLISE
ncbi:hypothetical protein [Achromobacter insolitus]|uniref:hypothetical protein n=1 Tax=Achromobacter insolitus TaxID=217204 RepID=UPI0020A584F5|nr:hypothetical protein [Achromobacter insolitus]MCP1404281.1 hypothetical protein [Achromobacter insolitus]